MNGSHPTLTWINPKNPSSDQRTYTASSVLYKEKSLGAFTTQLVDVLDGSLVLTATLSGVTAQDDGNEGITCRYKDFQKTLNISLSGKL